MDQKHIRSGLLFVGACILLGLALFLISRCSRSSSADVDHLGDNQVAAASSESAKLCSTSETYDHLKRELFRQAAEMRGRDEAPMAQIARYATIRVEQPLFAGEEAETGRINCTGSVTIDLPLNLVDGQGRRSMSGDIGYFIQPSADGDGNVVSVANAGTIVSALATLAKAEADESTSSGLTSEEDTPTPNDVVADPEADGDETDEQDSPAPSPGPVAVSSASGPSFNCNAARSRSEIAVCENASLSALDRDMAAFYRQSLAASDAGRAEQLRQTANRFLAYRDRCPTDACIANIYRGRISEIRDIMDGRWRP